jgi:hypothetical protein
MISCFVSGCCAAVIAGAVAGELRAQEPYAAPSEVEYQLREMKEVLRGLVNVQEHHFADYVEYTHSLATLMSHFEYLARRAAYDIRRPSAEVTLVLLQVTDWGWNAVAVHERARGYACAIYIGTAPPPFDHGSEEGEPTCIGPDGEQLE